MTNAIRFLTKVHEGPGSQTSLASCALQLDAAALGSVPEAHGRVSRPPVPDPGPPGQCSPVPHPVPPSPQKVPPRPSGAPGLGPSTSLCQRPDWHQAQKAVSSRKAAAPGPAALSAANGAYHPRSKMLPPHLRPGVLRTPPAPATLCPPEQPAENAPELAPLLLSVIAPLSPGGSALQPRTQERPLPSAPPGVTSPNRDGPTDGHTHAHARPGPALPPEPLFS